MVVGEGVEIYRRAAACVQQSGAANSEDLEVGSHGGGGESGDLTAGGGMRVTMCCGR